jgi:hypothetical protein
MIDAFKKADEVLLNAVQGISDLMTVPGLINVDFADVRTIMSKQGRALMGSGVGAGKRRAGDAAEMAISSPLLEDVNIEGATGILINITGGPDLGLHEVNEASSLIQQAAHEEANIIFGSVIDPNIGDEVRITVIATGFEREAMMREKQPPGRGGTPRRERSGSQIALPYDQGTVVTREYPPPMVSRRVAPGTGAVAAQVPHQQHPQYVQSHQSYPPQVYRRRVDSEADVPIHEDVDGALAELSREPYASMTVDVGGAPLAHGSGPTPAAYEASGQISAPPAGGETRRKPEFPKVHPSLRHVLAEVEVDSELDVPTFLRRASE